MSMENRLKHSYAVANRMKTLAEKHKDEIKASPGELFILGLLHDVGYMLSDNTQMHAQCGGDELKAQGYKYWKEVFYHGSVQKEYESVELVLLNYADMTVDSKGKSVSICERIRDIEKRYGENSFQKQSAQVMAQMLLTSPYKFIRTSSFD